MAEKETILEELRKKEAGTDRLPPNYQVVILVDVIAH